MTYALCYFALTGLISHVTPTQGFGRVAAFTLGFAMPRFQRLKKLSLTRTLIFNRLLLLLQLLR